MRSRLVFTNHPFGFGVWKSWNFETVETKGKDSGVIPALNTRCSAGLPTGSRSRVKQSKEGVTIHCGVLGG
jgi:hypothetical protein